VLDALDRLGLGERLPARRQRAFSQWAKWILAQLSVAQFYNPGFMRSYGTGILNASTWTISIELQFYILVPLIYAALRLQRLQHAQGNLALLALTAFFLLAHVAVSTSWIARQRYLSILTCRASRGFTCF